MAPGHGASLRGQSRGRRLTAPGEVSHSPPAHGNSNLDSRTLSGLGLDGEGAAHQSYTLIHTDQPQPTLASYMFKLEAAADIFNHQPGLFCGATECHSNPGCSG